MAGLGNVLIIGFEYAHLYTYGALLRVLCGVDLFNVNRDNARFEDAQ